MRFLDFAAVFVVLNLTCHLAIAAQAADAEVAVVLQDGTTLVGHVVEQDDSSLKVQTLGGLELDVPRSSVVSIRARGLEQPMAPAADPNYSRLMFAPTGRPLAKGDGYFSNHYVLFPGFSYGLTDNISLSGGVSTVPALGLDEQVFYVSPKLGARVAPHTWLSAGVLYARVADLDDNDLGLGYAVVTQDAGAGSVSAGLGVARTMHEDYNYDYDYDHPPSYTRRAEYKPILMLGGTAPLGKRVGLVSENWLVLGKDFNLARQPFGLAVRFFGERLSADMGFVFIGEMLDDGFPIPWLSFSYHFGGTRRGAITRPALGSGAGRVAPSLGAGRRY